MQKYVPKALILLSRAVVTNSAGGNWYVETADVNRATKRKGLVTDCKTLNHPFHSQKDRICPALLGDTWHVHASKVLGRCGIVPAGWPMTGAVIAQGHNGHIVASRGAMAPWNETLSA